MIAGMETRGWRWWWFFIPITSFFLLSAGITLNLATRFTIGQGISCLFPDPLAAADIALGRGGVKGYVKEEDCICRWKEQGLERRSGMRRNGQGVREAYSFNKPKDADPVLVFFPLRTGFNLLEGQGSWTSGDYLWKE